MAQHVWPIVNTIAFGGVVVANAVAGRRTGGVSARYETAFTPARGAFSIWGIIYALLAASVIAQFFDRALASALAVPFFVQAVCNVAWIVLFTQARVRAAGAMLIGVTASVGVAYARARALAEIHATWPRALARGTFALYLSWTLLASVLGLSIAFGAPAHWRPPARDRAIRIAVWLALWAAVATTQWCTTEPLISLPIAWGAAFRAQRGDGVSAVFSALFVITALITFARAQT